MLLLLLILRYVLENWYQEIRMRKFHTLQQTIWRKWAQLNIKIHLSNFLQSLEKMELMLMFHTSTVQVTLANMLISIGRK